MSRSDDLHLVSAIRLRGAIFLGIGLRFLGYNFMLAVRLRCLPRWKTLNLLLTAKISCVRLCHSKKSLAIAVAMQLWYTGHMTIVAHLFRLFTELGHFNYVLPLFPMFCACPFSLLLGGFWLYYGRSRGSWPRSALRIQPFVSVSHLGMYHRPQSLYRPDPCSADFGRETPKLWFEFCCRL